MIDKPLIDIKGDNFSSVSFWSDGVILVIDDGKGSHFQLTRESAEDLGIKLIDWAKR